MRHLVDPKFVPKVYGPHPHAAYRATQSELVTIFSSGTLQAADVWASHARSLGKGHQSTFCIETFHVQCQLFKIELINERHPSLHKAAKILWSCSHTEAVSLSDLNIKYKWQFIISIALQMFFKSSGSKWYETDGNQQNLCFCLQISINRCFTGRQVTCWKDRAVDLKERCKRRELPRQAAWAAETCAMGLRVWASLSTTPRKGTSAQNHEKSKFSSRKLWVYFEQQKSFRVCFA